VFMFMVPTALGSATAVLVGQALGAGNSRRARDAGLLGLGIAAAMGLALGSAMYVGSWALARAYTPDAAVAAIAAQLLLLVAAYHLADSVQAVMIQVLRAYKRTWGPTLVYAFSLWGVGLGGGYLLGLTDFFGAARGAAGFWLAATASLAVASVMTTLYFLRIAKAPVNHGLKLNQP